MQMLPEENRIPVDRLSHSNGASIAIRTAIAINPIPHLRTRSEIFLVLIGQCAHTITSGRWATGMGRACSHLATTAEARPLPITFVALRPMSIR